MRIVMLIGPFLHEAVLSAMLVGVLIRVARSGRWPDYVMLVGVASYRFLNGLHICVFGILPAVDALRPRLMSPWFFRMLPVSSILRELAFGIFLVGFLGICIGRAASRSKEAAPAALR